MAAGFSRRVSPAGSLIRAAPRQRHVQPDRRAVLVRLQFDLVADLVDDPEPVPAAPSSAAPAPEPDDPMSYTYTTDLGAIRAVVQRCAM